jgi:hypothetical protein
MPAQSAVTPAAAIFNMVCLPSKLPPRRPHHNVHHCEVGLFDSDQVPKAVSSVLPRVLGTSCALRNVVRGDEVPSRCAGHSGVDPSHSIMRLCHVAQDARLRLAGLGVDRDHLAVHPALDMHAVLDPRLPLPKDVNQFRKLAKVGGQLIALHLMEIPKLNELNTTYTGPKNPSVNQVGWSNNTIWLDAVMGKKDKQTRPGTVGFKGISADIRNFHIGGYQICEKWLKHRKGQKL